MQVCMSIGVGLRLDVGVGEGLDACDRPSLRDAGFLVAACFNMDVSYSGCRLACLLRWSDRIKRLSQMGQQNRFSPVKEKYTW